MIASRTRAFALLLLTVSAAAVMGAEQVSVEASLQGTAVAIEARATIRASHALIWQTLTDYDHLSEFIPGMLTSHVIERRGSAATVEQTGKAGFLLFTYPIEVTVESREEPPGFIGMRMLKGNVKQLDGGYRIVKAGGGEDNYVLLWSGLIERPSLLPPLITVPLMRSNIADQFLGMVKEIERREALRTGEHEGTRPLILLQLQEG
jgi:ribosome-associated toxin RatA of RatAB toxin-antitoxin module